MLRTRFSTSQSIFNSVGFLKTWSKWTLAYSWCLIQPLDYIIRIHPISCLWSWLLSLILNLWLLLMIYIERRWLWWYWIDWHSTRKHSLWFLLESNSMSFRCWLFRFLIWELFCNMFMLKSDTLLLINWPSMSVAVLTTHIYAVIH